MSPHSTGGRLSHSRDSIPVRTVRVGWAVSNDRRTYIEDDDLVHEGAGPAADEGPRFRVDEELARGGLGRVHRGWDHRLDREVAVKSLLTNTSSAQARFDREMRLTARLQHPNIVPVYDGGRDDAGLPFLAMRLVHGRSLADAIAACEGLSARLGLLPHVIDACNAVAYAHSQRIAHRDLKPDNILVGDFGETVVIDWGLAKDLDAADEPTIAGEPTSGGQSGSSASLTRVGAVVGTPAYMPPEQAAGRSVDERADVYALGAVLYHALAGHRPYDGEDDTLTAVLAGPPRSLESLAGVPPDLVAVVRKAMARIPADRYADARSLAAELERFQAGRFVSAYAYSPSERMLRLVRRHPVPTFLLVVLVVGTLVGIALLGRANRVAEARRAQAEQAERRIGDLRDQEREALDALTVEQARLVMTTDPSRSLELLAGLSEARPFDATVRTVATAAWSIQPPVHLPGPDGAPLRHAAASSGRIALAWDEELRVFDGELARITTARLGTPVSRVAALGDVVFACEGRQLSRLEGGELRSVLELPSRCEDLGASPDGRWLAVVLADAVVVVDADGRRSEHSFDERAVLFRWSANGSLWTVSDGEASIVHHPLDGRPARTLPSGRMTYGLVPAVDGRVVVLGGAEPLVLAEPVGGGFRKTPIDVPANWLEVGAWLGRDLVAVGGSDDAVFVVDVARREVVQTLRLRGAPLDMVALGAGRAAVSTDRGQLAVLEVKEDRVDLLPLGSIEAPLPTVLAGPGWLIAGGTRDAFAQRTDRPDGRVVARYDGRARFVRVGADGSLLVGGENGTERWKDGRRVATPTLRSSGGAIECGGREWVAGDGGAEVVGADVRVPIEGFVLVMACSPDGERLAMGTFQDEVWMVDARDGAPLGNWDTPAANLLTDLFFAGDGTLVVPADTIWSIVPGEAPRPLVETDSNVARASYDGETGFVAMSDGLLRPLEGGEPFGRLDSGLTTSMASRGNTVLVGDVNGLVTLFRGRGRSEWLVGHRQYVHATVIAPSGAEAVTGSWDETAWWWDLTTEPAVGRPLLGHGAAVLAVAFSPDGRRVYTADRAGVVREWSDPLARDPDRLRRQVKALAAALSVGEPLPDPASIP
ncbi:MAG: protein kinase [Alphaproteobacteria bacterium]|nr:protein kinase [Alphaproteobacteria bacterium]